MIKQDIVLRLLSDTLPGNGEGLAGIIDNDVCFDEYGLPYIPSRRIKGILREVAQQLNNFPSVSGVTDDVLAKLFQASGSSEEAKLSLGNGYLMNHQKIVDYLQYAYTKNELKKRFSPQSILSLYTYTRAQTSLENDLAKENTLRQSRVLKKGLEFRFDCRIENDLLPQLKAVIKLAKSMGLNRTRGLGEIELGLLEPSTNCETTCAAQTALCDTDTAALRLRISNHYPLLLSSESGKTQESQTYIPGSVILGACATQFIKAKKKTDPGYDPDTDQEFLSLFVYGSLSWGNAYLWANTQMSLPIPLSWKKDKQNDSIFNLADETERTDAENSAANLKGLGDAFYVMANNSYSHIKPKLKVEYHHQRPKDIAKGSPDKNDGEFYQFEVLAEGQEFAAQIIGKVADLKKIQELLGLGEIWLGKSRSAQYAYCKVTTSIEPLASKLEVDKGDTIYLTLISDAIVKNDNGLSVVTIEALRKEFIGLCNKHLSEQIQEDDLTPVWENSFISANRLGGFMNIWKLPKLQEPVFKAGSIITFKYQGPGIEIGKLQQYQLGLETHRGFGRFCLSSNAETGISFIHIPDPKDLTPQTMPAELKTIFSQALEQDIKAKAIKDSKKNFEAKSSASLVRRIMAAVDTGAQVPANKANAVIANIAAIKRKKDEKPAWIMHLEELVSSANYPAFLVPLLQNNTPDGNLATMESWLGIIQASKDSWFFLVELYCRHYLRNLALLLREKSGTAQPEVNNEETN